MPFANMRELGEPEPGGTHDYLQENIGREQRVITAVTSVHRTM
jgi:hypothetical protein